MRLIAISAMGKQRQIGLDGDLPWKIPQEYKHYQTTVRGHFLIVGRKNFEAHNEDIRIGTPLVITRNRNYHVGDNAYVFHNVEDVLDFLTKKNVEKAFVIGGEGVYSLFLPHLNEMMLSYIDYSGEGDTFFPEFNKNEWEIFQKEQRKNYFFCHYKRK